MTKKQHLSAIWKRVNRFNQKTAILVGAITGSMFFFWAFAGIIAYVRGIAGPEANNLLTAAENDIQVLLIASNSVTSTLTLALLIKLLHTICKKEAAICSELEGFRGEKNTGKERKGLIK
ncbi:MAG: hypothetical protein P4N59_09580 [Negativicutes bacterium]|nr:hypothetical protein [Negativicutes bacterium]